MEVKVKSVVTPVLLYKLHSYGAARNEGDSRKRNEELVKRKLTS